MQTDPLPVFFLPGGIMPANLSYAAILDRLDAAIRPVAEDLAIYDADSPPESYSLDLEDAALIESADRAGVERFHLVGYSIGATIALVCATRHTQRVESLVLFEPTLIDDLQTKQILAAGPFANQQLMLRPGATAPPRPVSAGPPPPWMAKRPAAFRPSIEACCQAFEQLIAAGTEYHGPVMYVLGADSNPEFFNPERARQFVPRMQLEVFPGCSHPNPPFRAVPDQVAERLLTFWKIDKSASRQN